MFVAGEIVMLSVIGVVVVIADALSERSSIVEDALFARRSGRGSAICTPVLWVVNPTGSGLGEWMARVGTG
jgi:hypothetical protein